MPAPLNTVPSPGHQCHRLCRSLFRQTDSSGCMLQIVTENAGKETAQPLKRVLFNAVINNLKEGMLKRR